MSATDLTSNTNAQHDYCPAMFTSLLLLKAIIVTGSSLTWKVHSMAQTLTLCCVNALAIPHSRALPIKQQYLPFHDEHVASSYVRLSQP